MNSEMGNFPDIPTHPGSSGRSPQQGFLPAGKGDFPEEPAPASRCRQGRESSRAGNGLQQAAGKCFGMERMGKIRIPALPCQQQARRWPGRGIPAEGSRPHPGSLRLSGSRDLMPASSGCSRLSTGQGFHHGFRNLFPNSSSRLPKPSPRALLGAGAMGAALPPGIFPRAGILSWRLTVLALKPGLSSRQDLPQLPWE